MTKPENDQNKQDDTSNNKEPKLSKKGKRKRVMSFIQFHHGELVNKSSTQPTQ
jgi:hypothetical protein